MVSEYHLRARLKMRSPYLEVIECTDKSDRQADAMWIFIQWTTSYKIIDIWHTDIQQYHISRQTRYQTQSDRRS